MEPFLLKPKVATQSPEEYKLAPSQTETVVKWFSNNDKALPTVSDTFTFAAMLVRNQTLVVVPGNINLAHFIDLVRVTYGPSLTLPDLYGFRGIQTITSTRPEEMRLGGSQVPNGEANKTLVLWSSSKSANVCIYNLTAAHCSLVCQELTGRRV